MGSFIDKVRALTLGTAHDLLDRTIDYNSPTMIRQYVRDIEDALGKMQSDAAIQAGQIRTMERERGDLAAKIKTGKATIQKIMSSSDPNSQVAARDRAASVVLLQKQMDDIDSRIEDQQKTSANMDGAVTQLQNKHDQMVIRVRDLERLDRDSKSKELAAKSIASAGRVLNAAGSASVDDIESKMRARNDVASEKFDRALGSLHTEEDPAVSGDVDSLLAELAPKPEAVAS